MQLTTATLELTLATIGLYSAVLFAPLFVHGARRDRRELIRRSRAPLIGAGAGALLLLGAAGRPGRSRRRGDLERGAAIPAAHGSSILFWALVPLAGAVLWARIRGAPRRWLVIVFLVCSCSGRS